MQREEVHSLETGQGRRIRTTFTRQEPREISPRDRQTCPFKLEVWSLTVILLAVNVCP